MLANLNRLPEQSSIAASQVANLEIYRLRTLTQPPKHAMSLDGTNQKLLFDFRFVFFARSGHPCPRVRAKKVDEPDWGRRERPSISISVARSAYLNGCHLGMSPGQPVSQTSSKVILKTREILFSFQSTKNPASTGGSLSFRLSLTKHCLYQSEFRVVDATFAPHFLEISHPVGCVRVGFAGRRTQVSNDSKSEIADCQNQAASNCGL
jgi:hypothetical protein